MSREQILKAIKAHKPPGMTVPEIDRERFKTLLPKAENRRLFMERVAEAGGSVVNVPEKELKSVLCETYGGFEKINDRSGKTALTTFTPDEKDTETLETLEVLIVEGKFGVTENGAVWLPETHCAVRVLPFITKHLVILLPAEALVETMHEAMDRLGKDTEAYGVFVSGPSKTADIEQSLVIGAHGALSVSVFLYD